MKMIYNGTPIKSLNIKHYEMDTNSATMVPSDLQAGITAFAKGKKVTGTGKSFEFAQYGELPTNTNRLVPSNINVIEVSSLEYPVKLTMALEYMKDTDFSYNQTIGKVIIDNVEYDLIVSVVSNMLRVTCEKDVKLQIFFGKDNYV